jgi:hypothetical protein
MGWNGHAICLSIGISYPTRMTTMQMIARWLLAVPVSLINVLKLFDVF